MSGEVKVSEEIVDPKNLGAAEEEDTKKKLIWRGA